MKNLPIFCLLILLTSMAMDQEKNPWDRQVYFGEQHLHTVESADAFSMGVRNTQNDAYKFFKGEAVTKTGVGYAWEGQVVQRKTPYDWGATTDHAYLMGMLPMALDPNSPVSKTEIAKLTASGDEKCHLVGHDWRALTAYMVANQRPDLLISLTALSFPYNVNLPRVLLRCPSYAVNGWYVTFFQFRGLSEWLVKRKNMKFINMLYRTWCPTWDRDKYDDRLASVKETLKAPGVLKAAFGYYRTSIYGWSRSAIKFRKWFSGRIEVPTLAIRGEVDWCIPEVAWELVSPKSFRSGLTMEVMPEIGHFSQLENPQWISKRLIARFKLHTI